MKLIQFICALVLSSCSLIYDDLQPCDTDKSQGIKFVYTYNMKYSDALDYEIHNQAIVKNINLFIYDSEGKFIKDEIIAGDDLQDGIYPLALTDGVYRLLAVGGLDESAYQWTKPSEGDDISEWQLSANIENGAVDAELPGLLQELDTLTVKDGVFLENVIDLKKHTNKLRISLIDVSSGENLKAEDFSFYARTENGDLDSNGNPITDKPIEWRPYYQSLEEVRGEDGSVALRAVCAELNCLRLIEHSNTLLSISRKGEVKPFFNVNLTDFLLLSMMESHQMTEQEYLDRQDEYKIVIYIDSSSDCGSTHYLKVLINDWVVRLDEVNLKEGGDGNV